jgi:putative restriction endonuclease
MKLYVGITDYDWFRYLQAMQPEELNFWQPGGMRLFKALLPGEPFLFQSRGPHSFIVGNRFLAPAPSMPTA